MGNSKVNFNNKNIFLWFYKLYNIYNKAKIRRLYDIANVLSTVSLIKKCSDSSITKPAYKYIGPPVQIDREAECELTKNFTFF